MLLIPLLSVAVAGASTPALVPPCQLPLPQGVAVEAAPLVRAACHEHRLWYGGFIDRDGRIAQIAVTEAEATMLADDGLRAWQQVARYWRESGTLGSAGQHPGAPSCLGAGSSPVEQALCRSFLLDTPWSATFISWLMRRAGIADFPASAAHLDYIRAAHRGQGPYTLADPYQVRIRPGDLLCHLRGNVQATDPASFAQALAEGRTHGWQSHCDLVVASNPGGNRTVYAIGGNVLNAVTMRLLPVDERGALAVPPAPAVQPECSLAAPEYCNQNRRHWVALLQLRLQPPAMLAAPPPNP